MIGQCWTPYASDYSSCGISSTPYRPTQHKTQHFNHDRIIYLGPKAQALITPFLRRDINDYLFKPREAMEQRWATKKQHRRENQKPNEKKTDRTYRERYTPQSLGYCIRRICVKNDIPHWSPNQLRHNAATNLRREFGMEVAKIALGHSDTKTTEIYAEADILRAQKAIEKVG